MGKKTRTKLLHCPVCGQKPRTKREGGYWHARCNGYFHSEEGIRVETHNLSVGPYPTLEIAAKAWNNLIRSVLKPKEECQDK